MRIILFLFLIGCGFGSIAKPSNCCQTIKQHYDVEISLLHAGIGMPNHLINGRIQPGLNLGIIRKQPNKKHVQHHVLFGIFRQQALQTALFVKPGIGYRIHIFKNFQLRPQINLALMGVRNSNKEFKWENGQYEAVNRNRFQVMPSLGLEAIYHGFKIQKYPIGIVLRYEFGMQLPFSNLSAVLPINQIAIGVRSSLKIKKS